MINVIKNMNNEEQRANMEKQRANTWFTRTVMLMAILFLFISCDESFKPSEPFSYDKTVSKIEERCKSDSDCKEYQFCKKEQCVLSPCFNENGKKKISCSGKGICKINSNFEAFCECDKLYQDNDNNNTCEPTCLNPIVDACHDNDIACDESSGTIKCSCKAGSFQNENYQCIDPCLSISCGRNRDCIPKNWDKHDCSDCEEGFYLNENNDCYSPCEGHENCSRGDSKLGNCIASDIENAKCTCNEGFILDENTMGNDKNLICIPENYNPCDEINCGGSIGECIIGDNPSTTNITEEAYCNCYDGYQDNNRNMVCAPACKDTDCGEHGVCNDDNDFKFCECNEGYQDSNFDMMCNPACNHPQYQCEAHGTCVTNANNDGLIQCTCPQGYKVTANGFSCYWNGYAWTKNFVGTSDNFANSMILDSNGNIYITGYFEETVDFDPSDAIDEHTSNGYSDIFITKLNNDGSYVWTKTFGGIEDDRVNSIAIDSNNNVYIAGSFGGIVDFDSSNAVDEHTSNGNNDAFITKLNNDGSYAWTKTFRSSNSNHISSMLLDSNNNIYIMGGFSGTVDFDPSDAVDEHISNGESDIFITKLNNDDSYAWTKTFGGINWDSAGAIALDSSNNIYIIGGFWGTVDFDPSDAVDEHRANIYSVDIFITKLNSDGSYSWTKTFGGGDDDYANFISLDNDDNIYIAGGFHETVDFDPRDTIDEHISNGDNDVFITKLNSDGSYAWTKTFGGIEDDRANSIAIDSNNNVYIAGSFGGIVDFDSSNAVDEHSSNGVNDIFITKLNSDASYTWTKTFGYSGDNSIILDSNNNIYIAGYFNGTVDFDPSDAVDEHISNRYSGFIWKYSLKESICDNINCNNHGRCQTDENDNPFCSCDIGYQDNEADLYCEPSCNNTNINNCGIRGTCDDSSGNVVCLCDVGYALDGNFQCDKCDYGFHKDENYKCIAKNGYSPWVKTFGGSSYENTNSITLDNDNNIYIVGYFNGTVDFDFSNAVDEHTTNGGMDIFITKLNNDGSYAWTKTFGGTKDDRAYSIAIDSNNNIYVTGSFYRTVDFDPSNAIDEHTSNGNNDAFITKLNNDGSYAWTKTFGGTDYDYADSISLDNDNNIYVAGLFHETVDFDPSDAVDEHGSSGNNDAFITKLNNDGSYVWTKAFGGISSYYAKVNSIVLDSDGNIYITGYFSGTVDFDPSDVVDEHTSLGGYDVFITKLNNSGSYTWIKTFGGSGNDVANSIAIDINNNIYITGYFSETVDFAPNNTVDEHTSNGYSDAFITKLNNNGSYAWTKTLGGSGNDVVNSIAPDIDGNIYIAGSFSETVDFDSSNTADEHRSNGINDVFITKLNNDGSYTWTKTFGGDDSDNANSITLDTDNNIYTIGNFNHTMNIQVLGSKKEYISKGDYDIFLWKYNTNDSLTCDIMSCDTNSHCVTQDNNSGCVCNNGYHLNGNFQCITD